ncbi:MAG: HEAT repeat domain-containing protein [Pseudomonadota bacterium]
MWESATAAAYALEEMGEKTFNKFKVLPFVSSSTLLVMLFVVVRSLLLSSPLAYSAEAPKKGYLLDQALEAVAMKRSDLSIRTDLFPDPLVSSRFKSWMENPLKAPVEAQDVAMGLFRTAKDPVLLLQEVGRSLSSYSTSPLPLVGYRDLMLPDNLPGQLIEAIHLLLDSIYTANRRLSRVRNQVPLEKMELIKKYLYRDLQGQIDPEREILEAVNAKKSREAIDAAASLDWQGIFEAGLTVVNGMSRAQALLLEDNKWHSTVDSFALMIPLGLLKIGGTSSDIHEEDPILILDLGGDDLYRGKVASGSDGRCAVVLDLGGDDVYLGEDYTQASGRWGVGILYDLTGNDLYRARNWSQGAGLFGVGLLVDGNGNDTYIGGSFVQAASSWGWSGLIDLDGEDLYRCNHSGQAYSGVLGVSALCDINGNDRYISGAQAPDPREPDMDQSFSQGFAFGMRNLAGGGFSILADRSGNDLYQCQYFGQGASYWAGIGILYDERGKDVYIARRYAQGAGIHFSLGILMDVYGSDHTFSWGVSQGCGHDYGIGILVNEAGEDTYVSDWLSMGASEADGVGIFVDNSGDDGYEARACMGLGSLTEGRRAGGIGLFVDAAGKDRYSHRGGDNSVWIKNRWGVGIDEDMAGKSGLNLASPGVGPHDRPGWEEKREGEKTLLSRMLERSESIPYPSNLGAMFSIASHWGLDKEIPDEAKERLLGLEGEKSVPVLMEFIDTPDVTGLVFLERFFMVHAFHALPELMKKAQAPDPLLRSRACRHLGLLRDTSAIQCLVGALKDPSWHVRSSAIWSLGEILDKRRLMALIPMRAAFEEALKKGSQHPIKKYLEDEKRRRDLLSVLVRALPMDYQTYKKLGKMPSGAEARKPLDGYAAFAYDNLDEILPLVETWIGDIKRSDAIASELARYLDDDDPEVKRAAAYSLGQMDYRPVIPELLRLLRAQRPWVRDSAALSLELFGDSGIYPIESEMKKEGPKFRIIALDILGRIGGEKAGAVIEKYIRDPDPNVRRAADRAMGRGAT